MNLTMFGRKKTVKESAQATPGSVVGTGVSKKQITKRILIICGLALVVGVLVVLVTKKDQFFANQCKGEATSPIYNEAQASLVKLAKPDLKKTIEKIKKQRNFEKDANCLYPVVIHYIREGDSKNAEKYYAKLQLSFNENIGIAKAYGATEGIKTIKDMAIPIAGLQKQKERMNENSLFPSVQ